MAITSILFLLLFLPLSLAIYYVVDDKAKKHVLLVISLLFYAFGSLEFFALFIILVGITVFIGRSIAVANNQHIKRIVFIMGIIVNVSALFLLKYSKYSLLQVGSMRYLPLGISFFTFKAISYLTDIYKGDVALSGNVVNDAVYLSFFGQVQSGPLTRYKQMEYVLSGVDDKISFFSDGVYRFIIGFNKKVLIANVLSNITDEIFLLESSDVSTALVWLGSICYSLQLFFDFAGYSDMAIGLSEMFGYRCCENFNYPYMTESVSKFWRRWHISLSQWFRDYIYIPMGGSKTKSKLRAFFNLAVVWMLTGLWHGATWNFILWGINYFLFIAFEKSTGLPQRLTNRVVKTIYRVIVLLFINFQWVLFRADNIDRGLYIIKNMIICRMNSIADRRCLFLLKDYLFFIIVAIVLCFPVVPWIEKKLNGKAVKYIFDLSIGIIVCGAFILSLSFIVAGQNNPFAYANF